MPEAGGGVVASTGFAVEPWTEAVCATVSWDGTFKLLSLNSSAGAGQEGPEGPLLKSFSVVEEAEEDDEESGAGDVRFFLARRWEAGEGHTAGSAGAAGVDRGIWPPLWCGDRRTGSLRRVDFSRVPSGGNEETL